MDDNSIKTPMELISFTFFILFLIFFFFLVCGCIFQLVRLSLLRMCAKRRAAQGGVEALNNPSSVVLQSALSTGENYSSSTLSSPASSNHSGPIPTDRISTVARYVDRRPRMQQDTAESDDMIVQQVEITLANVPLIDSKQ